MRLVKLLGGPAMSKRPKALIAWSSGKDSAWALHETPPRRRLRDRGRAHDRHRGRSAG